MGFPRQEYWSRLPFPSPGDIPGPVIKPHLMHWWVGFLPLSHQGCLCVVSPKGRSWKEQWGTQQSERGSHLLLKNFSIFPDLSKVGLPESQNLQRLLDLNSYCPVTFAERILVSQILQCTLLSFFFPGSSLI